MFLPFVAIAASLVLDRNGAISKAAERAADPQAMAAFKCSVKLADRYATTTAEPAETIAAAALTGCEVEWQRLFSAADRIRHAPYVVSTIIAEQKQVAMPMLVQLVLELRSMHLPPPDQRKP